MRWLWSPARAFRLLERTKRCLLQAKSSLDSLKNSNATELSKVPKAGFSIIDGQSATWDFVSIA
jgi:hypothetical protein